ncbi:lactonase family protein [Mucilaginibacter auburnensis]|uniref:6-phosphogluconolactonase (Cycloisomerase 2 family) n=1 Tax=Mucilaginibacter auburnensis TaxID=1457233 RepID=A0A2H9VQF1_9SPHI|nr:lactonase family protein [Mucilaginibacter auburnensis]PJJ80525.1 6-phosphogluconolactonase (cycloisomerase 2 family) [Mucilaginibacter auburnensis]
MNKLLACLCFIILLPVLVMAQKKDKNAPPKVFDLLIGGYTSPDGNSGITVYRFYAETGRVSFLGETATSNPSYLCVSPDRKFVYTVNEDAQGGVSAFSFDYNSGKLNFINKQSSGGAQPAHITIDKEARNVIVSNYGDGKLTVLPVNKDGSLAPASQTITDEGGSVNPERQKGPHIHSAVLSPDEKHLLYADLGTDKVYINKYKAGKTPALIPESTPFEQVNPGDGPRHMEFSADGKFLYLVNEMGAAVNSFAFADGKLKFIDSVSMVPPGFTGEKAGADIHLSPDGNYLYATNRGALNELLVYATDKVTGKLRFLTRYHTGQGPRNFTVEPGGNFLILAAQKSNEVSIYKFDKKTGVLIPLNNTISVSSPSVVKLVSAE